MKKRLIKWLSIGVCYIFTIFAIEYMNGVYAGLGSDLVISRGGVALCLGICIVYERFEK